MVMSYLVKQPTQLRLLSLCRKGTPSRLVSHSAHLACNMAEQCDIMLHLL